MSVEALRARIVALDNEIERQKSLLEKLEKDKIRTLRQLNVALDPVARLPLEISSEIFLQSLATNTSGKQDIPVTLLRICSAWTDIALSTPRLWTTVRVNFPCGDELADVLPIWFKRSRNLPLSISISLRGQSINWNHDVSDVIWSHAGQFQHLEILDNDDLASGEEIDLFGDVAPVSLPLLETLTIHCQCEERTYLWSQISELLSRAPCIAESNFRNMASSSNHGGSGTLIVPTLRRLIFGDEDTGEDNILCHLSLPTLVTLSLPMYSVAYEDLLAFLERSAAPLQDLTLGWEFDALDSVQLHDCLRLIPSLTRFRMVRPTSDVVMEFFAALANTPSLLPNLRDLTILRARHQGQARISYSSWRDLVRALSTRRIERLYVVPVADCLPTDVLDSLQELVVAGANIHIGTYKLNLLAA